MQDAYINTLSIRTRELVRRIEQYIQSEIVVEVDSRRVETLACEVDIDEAKILIPGNGYFPESSVVHEPVGWADEGSPTIHGNGGEAMEYRCTRESGGYMLLYC